MARRHRKAARDVIAEPVTSSIGECDLLPQSHEDRDRPDTCARTAIVFGLFDRDNASAHKMLDGRRPAGPSRRSCVVPPGDDGFAEIEGASCRCRSWR